MRILILCTGNTCRSQMAEGFLKSADPSLEVYSAGTRPGDSVHSKAVTIMREVGIDIRDYYPKDISQFLDQDFDYVISVCKEAKKACPVFKGKTRRVYIPIKDPVHVHGTDDERLRVFREVREEVREKFGGFLREYVANR